MGSLAPRCGTGQFRLRAAEGDRMRLEQTMGKVLDGAAIAAAIKGEVAERVRGLAAQGIRPGLAAVLVGNVAASEIYVRSKVQACAELGIYSRSEEHTSELQS